MAGVVSQKKLKGKVALLQSHFKGELKDDNIDQAGTGDWSPENIKRNRERYLKEHSPWVLEGLSVSEYYEKYIKPKQEPLAA
jgi:hypothetical protein